MGGSSTPNDAVAASIRTQQEFEQYWRERRSATPKPEPEPVALVESTQAASVPMSEPEPFVSSGPVESPAVESGPQETWPVEEPINGSRPSKRDALSVTTWWEYRGDTGRGARDYKNLGAGGFPTGKKVFGSRKYVVSPYHGGYVKVGDVPRGALVADPNYDLAERKYFILP